MRRLLYFFMKNNTFFLFATSCGLYVLWTILLFACFGSAFSPLRYITLAAALYTFVLCLLYKKLDRLVSFTLFVLLVVAYSLLVIVCTQMVCGTEFYLLCAIPGVLLLTAEYKRPWWYYHVMNVVIVAAIGFTIYARFRWLSSNDVFDAERRLFLSLSKLCCAGTSFLLMIYAGINTRGLLLHFDHKSRFLRQKLNYTATHDVLTSLMNRRRTMEIFAQIEQRKAQENVDYAICIFDIDNFKRINDTYGHDAGDFVLKSYSRAIWDFYPHPNHVARWGGEEFLIIYTEVTPETIYDLERVRKYVAERPIVYRGTPIPVTATFGISSSRTLTSAEAVLNDADQMLLEGKSNGKNRIVVSERF